MLQAERHRLGSSRRLAELASEAQERIQGDAHGMLANLVSMERVLGELAQIDPAMEGTGRLASEAKVLLKEVADSLRGYAEGLDADPMRLSAIEDRLAVIQKMKKKYGGTIEAVLETYQRVKQELERLRRSDSELDRYERLIQEQQQKVSALARALSEKRAEAAKRLTKLVDKAAPCAEDGIGTVSGPSRCRTSLTNATVLMGAIVSSFCCRPMSGSR